MAIHNSVVVDSGQEAANLFVSTSVSGDALTTMYFCNKTASTIGVNVYVVSSGFKNSNIHTKCTSPNNFVKQFTNCYDKHCYNVIVIENINCVDIPHNLTEYGIELYYV
jgi:hypothetical protein